MRIAILGGCGRLGSALGVWWAKQGQEIILGSRDAKKAAAAALALGASVPGGILRGTSNEEAAVAGELVVLSVPYAVHLSTLTQVREALQGKILIVATVPLQPPRVGRVQLPSAGSAAVEAQTLLGADVKVVAAFHNVSAHAFSDATPPQCDVLVTSDDEASAAQVIGLIEAGGLVAWHAGPLANSAASEALTSVLISINRRYGSKAAGLRIALNRPG